MGAWINAALVALFAYRAGLLSLDASLSRSIARLTGAAILLSAALLAAEHAGASLFRDWTHGRDEATLLIVMVVGAGVYGALLLVMFGSRWRAFIKGQARTID
jgi:putative peptidoglycan lipid II flippase